jgi:hypothetical protein
LAQAVLEGLRSFFLQIDIAEIVIHEADEPDAVADFLDADRLAGQTKLKLDELRILICTVE